DEFSTDPYPSGRLCMPGGVSKEPRKRKHEGGLRKGCNVLCPSYRPRGKLWQPGWSWASAVPLALYI
ncbi:mCG67263, partial [Mus musculus]